MIPMLSFFSGWQVKLVIVAALIFSAWVWHKSEIKIAVSAAEQRLELQYAREIFKLKDKANEESIALKNRIESQRKTTDAKLKDADARYNDLLAWLSAQSGSSISNIGVSNNPSNAESTRGTYFGGLYTEDAIALAESSRSAERLKIELLACYKQYDEVKDTLDNFRIKNASKTD